MPSLYIHIPFCRKKCLYCDFYSVSGAAGNLLTNYISLLCRQIRELKGPFSSIYIGGGTPTVLGVVLLEKLLKRLEKFVTPGIEWTVEANPESLDKDILKLFRAQGVNRLSLGVQSLNEKKLKKLGRIHNVQRALKSVELAHYAGIKNISLDLIFGVWGEDLSGWKEELRQVVSLPIKHISCYSLTYEKDAALYPAFKKGLIKPLDDKIEAQMYRYAIEYLEKSAFSHYEISNFAREGYLCRHNLNYWRNDEYTGLGPSAVSYIGGLRRQNVANIADYILRFKENKSLVSFRERLSPLRRAKETAALKIRTKEGINLQWFKQKTGFEFLQLEKDALDNLLSAGLLDYRKNFGRIEGVGLTKKGFLFCDRVSSKFL